MFVQAPLLEDHRVATCDYLSDPMPADVELIGPMALTLHASIDSTDTNWMASVIDVAPDGTEVELTRGFLKASHHAVDEARSRPWQPYHPHLESVPVEPGRVHEYRIELSPLANVFAEGHRIKLSISSLDHGQWPPRDPELGADHQPWHVCRSVTIAHSIHRGPKHPSALLTPLVSGELP